MRYSLPPQVKSSQLHMPRTCCLKKALIQAKEIGAPLHVQGRQRLPARFSGQGDMWPEWALFRLQPSCGQGRVNLVP